MRNFLWKTFGLLAAVVLVMSTVASCSRANSVCRVTYNASDRKLQVAITPQGESGDPTIHDQRGFFERETKITDGKVTQITEPINLTVTYSNSGNVYKVTGHVILGVKDTKVTLSDYDLLVGGGIYTTPQSCKK